MTSPKFTLIIPTLNRSGFLVRNLRYYRDNGFQGVILIGDSSDDEHVRVLREEIEAIGPALQVVHRFCPGMSDRETLMALSEMVETPYVAFTGDDDYLVPAAVDACVTFLDDHPDYVAAQGRARNFELDRSGAFGRMRVTSGYYLRGIENDTAEQRLTWYLKDYTPSIFAVHRRETWQYMWAQSLDLADRSFASELLPCCMSVVCGKTKLLDDLYLLRQTHDSHYSQPGFLDWVSSADWAPSCRAFVSRLGAEIARLDGIEPAAAELQVKRMFATYLFTDWGTLTHKARRLYMRFRDTVRPTERWASENLPRPMFDLLRKSAIAVFGSISYLRRVPFLVVMKMEHLASRLISRLRWDYADSLRKAGESSIRPPTSDR